MTATATAPALTMSQLRLEQRSFWRNRQAAVFSFLLPILFVVLFGALFRGNNTVGTSQVSYTSYFVAGMIGISVLSATFNTLAIGITIQRDQLILKRFRGTPLGPGPLFAAKIISSLIVVVLDVVLILAIGHVFYNIVLPRNPLAFVLMLLMGSVVFAAGGVAFTAFIPNADSAPAVVQVPYLVLMFISGVFFPFADEPAFLRHVADFFPLRWLLDGLRAGYLGFDYVHTTRMRVPNGAPGGTSIEHVPRAVHGAEAITALGTAYLVLGIWLVVFLVIAVRRFRWEPRR